MAFIADCGNLLRITHTFISTILPTKMVILNNLFESGDLSNLSIYSTRIRRNLNSGCFGAFLLRSHGSMKLIN